MCWILRWWFSLWIMEVQNREYSDSDGDGDGDGNGDGDGDGDINSDGDGDGDINSDGDNNMISMVMVISMAMLISRCF